MAIAENEVVRLLRMEKYPNRLFLLSYLLSLSLLFPPPYLIFLSHPLSPPPLHFFPLMFDIFPQFVVQAKQNMNATGRRIRRIPSKTFLFTLFLLVLLSLFLFPLTSSSYLRIGFNSCCNVDLCLPCVGRMGNI